MRKFLTFFVVLLSLVAAAFAEPGGAHIKELASFPTDKVFQSLISPDGSLIAVASKSEFAIWDRYSGKKIRVIPSTPRVNAVEFSRQGGKLALGYDNGDIKIVDARTGAAIASTHATESVDVIAFSPDDTKMGVGTHHAFAIWALTGVGMQVVGKPDFGECSDIRFSPDGNVMACSAFDANVYLVDANTMKLKNKLTDLQLPTYSMAFSADGSRLFLAGGSGKAAVVNARTWTVEKEYDALPGITERMAVSDDGKRLAMLQADQRNFDMPSIVTLSDISGPKPKDLMKETRVPGMYMRFTPSGEFLFTRWSDGALHLYSYQP
jgi:WD40 repeat protein